MGVAIKVENLSKQYRLGKIGTGSIAHDLNKWWHTLRGKENPYLKIGETNDRSTKGNSDYVWSLKDINFEIEQGDAVGIIGRNGAGKSTLLKILSRVTGPTTGSVKVKGRIASLLEVGTGFHPELSGRENIFLNGAILGMRKHEIQRKFDEIVDFAGVERYIDTPVKRYSSGMYVRLAFAVAAHLESEILIVDEVLAVGDAEFQKKCLGKMGEVNKGEGRTVLFVSHNIASITNLCKSGILLTNGQIILHDDVYKVVDKYLVDTNLTLNKKITFERLLTLDSSIKSRILSLELLNEKLHYQSTINLEVTFTVEKLYKENLIIGIGINTLSGTRILTIENLDYISRNIKHDKIIKTLISLPNPGLSPGMYTISVGMRNLNHKKALGYIPDAIKFEVENTPETLMISNQPELGLRPPSNWEYIK